MGEMKDSGIEWIGEIPKDWNVSPIRYEFQEVLNKNILLKEHKCLKFTFGEIVPKSDFNENVDDYVERTICNYYIVEPGDIVLNGLNLNFDYVTLRIGQVKFRGVITSSYISFRIINSLKLLSGYVTYLFKSYDNCKSFHNMGGGVRKILNFSEFKKNYFIFPSYSEQQRIANFLDQKCKSIDALISDIQTQIETLEDYKKSVISEAVTKGLDPNIEMKDSGIEWIGKIPKHWDVCPLYCYFNERKEKNYNLFEQNLLSLSYGRIITKDINSVGGLLPANFSTYNIVQKHDIIIRPTDLQNDKRSLRTGLVNEKKGIITSAYIALQPRDCVNSKYFHYLLHTYDVMKVFYNMGNGVRQNLNYCEFCKLMVLAPTFEEQVKIADYLDQKCAEIDIIISDKQKQLEILKEYKKSVIYEYVTGKKEVV